MYMAVLDLICLVFKLKLSCKNISDVIIFSFLWLNLNWDVTELNNCKCDRICIIHIICILSAQWPNGWGFGLRCRRSRDLFRVVSWNFFLVEIIKAYCRILIFTGKLNPVTYTLMPAINFVANFVTYYRQSVWKQEMGNHLLPTCQRSVSYSTRWLSENKIKVLPWRVLIPYWEFDDL